MLQDLRPVHAGPGVTVALKGIAGREFQAYRCGSTAPNQTAEASSERREAESEDPNRPRPVQGALTHQWVTAWTRGDQCLTSSSQTGINGDLCVTLWTEHLRLTHITLPVSCFFTDVITEETKLKEGLVGI